MNLLVQQSSKRKYIHIHICDTVHKHVVYRDAYTANEGHIYKLVQFFTMIN